MRIDTPPQARMSAGGGTISSVRMIGCFGTFQKPLLYRFRL
jgi:hypothetical protein